MHSTVGLTEDALLKLTSNSPGRSHLCLIQSFVKDVTVRSRHQPVKNHFSVTNFLKMSFEGVEWSRVELYHLSKYCICWWHEL